MASSYQTVSSYATVKVMSPTQVQDVEWVAFFTQPTGIYCEYGVPLLSFQTQGTAAGTQPILDNLAQAIEQVVPGNGVVGGTFVQDTDPITGLLTDYVQYFQAYTDPTTGGVFTTQTNIPVASLITFGPTGIGGYQVPSTTKYPSPDVTLQTAYQSLVALAG